MIKVLYNFEHLNPWFPVGGTVWEVQDVQPCKRKYVTEGGHGMFKDSSHLQFALCLHFQNMRPQLSVPAAMTPLSKDGTKTSEA